MRHSFTEKIMSVLGEHFDDYAGQVFDNSELIRYINNKTVSANRGSKSRSSFGNLYAIYVLVEDYLNKGYDRGGNYSKYEGAKFSDLYTRQRQLPFGSKLQNHALNQRMNQEFRKLFPTCEYIPIIRVVKSKRYWVNTGLLEIKIDKKVFDISRAIIDIINSYVDSKRSAFESFIETCERFKTIANEEPTKIVEFILGLLEPNVDARIFEIVSYSILKADYREQTVFFGKTMETINEENLRLYKTGRTNANDGGIDFVMKPLGRFFQVTETTDVKKYFLDIDKLEKFPVTFVVKSDESSTDLLSKIREGAKKQYSVDAVVDKYISCVEEIINLDTLKKSLAKTEVSGNLDSVLSEIILQSKVEFNYE